MKTLIIAACIALAGCATPKTVYVNVEVWTPPKFEKPQRPIMRDSNAAKTPGEVVRDAELNAIDLETYANSLEEIVKSIK